MTPTQQTRPAITAHEVRMASLPGTSRDEARHATEQAADALEFWGKHRPEIIILLAYYEGTLQALIEHLGRDKAGQHYIPRLERVQRMRKALL